MPKLIYTGEAPSYTFKNHRFFRDPDTAQQHGADEDGAVEVSDEDDVQYLISTRVFEYARDKKAKPKRGGVTIGRTKAAAAPAPTGPVKFPANGFGSKRDLQAFAREHLGYEADLTKALKTLNAEALAKFEEKFVKPAEAKAEERPSDLGFGADDDGELDTGTQLQTAGADLDDDGLDDEGADDETEGADEGADGKTETGGATA